VTTSPAFEWLSAELPRCTALSSLQARGTVRLMLQDVGIDPRGLRKDQLMVLLRRQLPVELKKRHIASDANLGAELAARLLSTPLREPRRGDSPEAVFARLGSL